jgi:hypothetical protein
VANYTYIGNGPPAAGLGVVYDTYLDQTNDLAYTKSATGWGVGASASEIVVGLNVMDDQFGTVADSNDAGTVGTDAIPGITAALAAAAPGANIIFPAGKYRLLSRIVVDRDDITFVFEAGAQLILNPGANTNVIRVNPNADTNTFGLARIRRFRMVGGRINMNGASQGNVAGQVDGCIVAIGLDDVSFEGVTVKDSKNCAFEARGCTTQNFERCRVDGVYSGNNGNGFNVGQTGKTVGLDITLRDCVAKGVQDVAFFVGGSGVRRLTIEGCTVRGDAFKTHADGAITAGTGVFTSASAVFAPEDVGKTITIQGAGPAGAALTARIYSYTNATTIALAVNANTTVAGAVFSYGHDGAPARQLADGAITVGTSALASATAAFTAADIQKGVFVRGAGAGGADVYGKITAVADASHATVDFVAGTTVAAARVIVNCTSSGVLSEGSDGNSRYVSIVGNHVVGTVNVGLGGSDANAAVNASKHDVFTLGNNTIAGTYGTALWLTGNQHSLGSNMVDNFHGAGVVIGAGTDIPERDFTLTGGTITAASDATGVALRINKFGGGASWLERVTLIGVTCVGNGGGTRGISIEGKVRDIEAIGCHVSGFKNSGLVALASGGSSPVNVKVIGGDYRNNNQAANAAGVNSAGLAFAASVDQYTLLGVRATDDQGAKTQTHGLYALGATRGTIKDCDFTGNLTAAANTTFDALTIYANNKDVDAAYEGSATLVAGQVVVNTAAVKSAGAGQWSRIQLSRITPGGTLGALHVSALVNGTSFTIKSTDAGDTSLVFWRIG